MLQLNGSEILDIPTKSTLDLERDEDALSDCEYLNTIVRKSLRGVSRPNVAHNG